MIIWPLSQHIIVRLGVSTVNYTDLHILVIGANGVNYKLRNSSTDASVCLGTDGSMFPRPGKILEVDDDENRS